MPSTGSGLATCGPGSRLRAVDAAGNTSGQGLPPFTSLPMPCGCGLVFLGQVVHIPACIA